MTTQFAKTDAQSNSPQYREIDGPKGKGLRRILRVLHLILQPTAYMEHQVQRYGPVFQIGGDTSPPLVYVGDPNLVREIFALDASKVVTGQNNGVLRSMVGNHSILLLDSDSHQRQRKLLMPSFHGDCLRSYGQLIYDLTRDWLYSLP